MADNVAGTFSDGNFFARPRRHAINRWREMAFLVEPENAFRAANATKKAQTHGAAGKMWHGFSAG